MSLSTHLAPPHAAARPAIGRPDRARDAGAGTDSAAQAVPFARPPAGGVGGWVAGLLFGALCLVAAFAFLTAIAVVALARAAWYLVSALAETRPGVARVGRPALV